MLWLASDQEKNLGLQKLRLGLSTKVRGRAEPAQLNLLRSTGLAQLLPFPCLPRPSYSVVLGPRLWLAMSAQHITLNWACTMWSDYLLMLDQKVQHI